VRKRQGKLIRVIEGEIFDVAVDVRHGSPTIGRRWVGIALTADSFKQIHSRRLRAPLRRVSAIAQIECNCTDVYDPAGEIGIAWDDPALAISWPVIDPTLSPRDRRHPTLAAVADQLPADSTDL
jgi:dTDP-4-dehydrorhamnose 3,5-epimerase